MSRIRYSWLVCRAVVALLQYDIVYRVRGFGPINRRLVATQIDGPEDAAIERNVCAAVLLATCVYWKPVRCLQRSVCTVWMLRARRVPARLVIGYRPAPFFSHAWVEVNS